MTTGTNIDETLTIGTTTADNQYLNPSIKQAYMETIKEQTNLQYQFTSGDIRQVLRENSAQANELKDEAIEILGMEETEERRYVCPEGEEYTLWQYEIRISPANANMVEP